ncbi:MAG: hypothetical protein J6S40_08680, partial [Thermoguttaceae bacterium]|nr:hypothetical protein [Thermoguttaceae bacterium]
VSGVFGDDQVSVSVSGAFADAAAGDGKTVNLTYVMDGAQAGNYVLSANATTTANIDKLRLTISGTRVADKDYDRMTVADITPGTVSGVIGQDDVVVTASGAFPSANIGTYDVAVTYSISGDDAANYLAPASENISAKIKPIDFTATFEDAEKVYTASGQSIQVSGTLEGDAVLYSTDGVTYSVDVPEFTNVGEYTVYAKVQRANYNDWTGNAVFSITPATITAVGTVSNKTYDGGVSATTAVTFSGVLGQDVITVTVSGQFTDKAAAEGKTVNLTYVMDGAQARNYVLSANETATADIDKVQLSVSGTTVADKDYNGSAAATITLGDVAGVVEGDDVTVTASGAFPSANVGTYDVAVTYTISGDDAANYIAPATENISAKIKPIDFTATFEDAEKVYTASAQSITVSGTLEGDAVLYSTDGVTYSVDVPEFTNVGQYTVYAKVQRANYNDWTKSATLSITPATITAVGTAEDKDYDGGVSARTAVTFSGVLREDDVTVSVSGVFADKTAAEGKTVNLTYVLGGAQAGNYVLDANETASADIDAIPLSISGTKVADKSYNGTTAAAITVGELSGVLDGDVVAAVPAGEFPSSDVGIYNVTVTYTLSGRDAANYVAPAADTISAKINPIEFAVTFNGATVGYDASTHSIAVSGTLEGDTVLYSTDGETYDDETPVFTDAGDHTVYAKVQRENYSDWTGSAVLSITPATITAVGTASNKTYDGGVSATTAVTFSGVLGEDEVTVSVSGVFADKAAAEGKTVNLTYALGGAQAGNYVLAKNDTATANINKVQLSVSGTSVADKDYNGTTAAAITLGEVDGAVEGDNVTVAASGAFPSANIGTYDVAVTYSISGDDAANYIAPASENISAKIKPVDFEIEFEDAEFAYSASAKSIEVSGTLEGDVIQYSTDGTTYGASVPEYTNVGEYTIFAKVQRANYNDWTGSAVLSITPATITAVGTAEGKDYDGGVSATTAVTFSGVLGEDEVTVSVSGVFADKTAAEGKTVNLTYQLGGAKAGNYVLSANATATADIDKLQLTISGTSVADKDYNGTTAAAITLGDVAGVVEGDNVTVAASGAFPSADVGTYDVAVSYALTGDDASNYIAPAAQTFSASIVALPAPAITFSDAQKVYTASAQSIEVSGTLEGDVVLYSEDGVTYSVDAPGFTNVGRYTVYAKVQRTGHADWTGHATLSITPADLTVNFSVSDKTYDGTKTAEVLGYTFDGLLGNDVVTVTVSDAEFTDRNAGSDIAVDVDYTTGGAVGNYSISSTASASINAIRLSISGTSVADKDYDGTDTASITVGTLSGVLEGESVGVTASGAFPSSDVGTYNVTVSYTLTGDAAVNYFAPAAQMFAARITELPAPAITFSDAEKVYNGSGQSITVGGTLEGDTVLYSTDGQTYSANAPTFINVGDYTVYAKVQRTGHAEWSGSAVLSITPATITVDGTFVWDKVFDGTTTAQIELGEVTGIADGDDVTVTASGALPSSQPGIWDITVTYGLTGADAANYTVSPASEDFRVEISGPEIPSMVVTTSGDVVDATDGLISLREALTVYYKTDGTMSYDNGTVIYNTGTNTTVTFAAGLAGLNPTKTYELTSAHDGLVIDGDDRIVFDNKTFIIFTQTGNADVTLKGLTFSNISPSGHGAAYSCTAGFAGTPFSKTVTFDDCAFTGNTNSGSTSAIAAIGINAYVKNSTFTGNTGSFGPIWTGFGNLTVEGSTFTRNSAGSGGGAIYSQTWGTNTYTVTVTDSTFENNSGLAA